MVTVSLKTPDMMCTAHKCFADPTLRTTGSEQIIHCVCVRISGGRDFNAWSLQRPHFCWNMCCSGLEWRSWFDPCGRSSYIFHDRLASKMGVLCQKMWFGDMKKRWSDKANSQLLHYQEAKFQKSLFSRGKKKRWMHIIISY